MRRLKKWVWKQKSSDALRAGIRMDRSWPAAGAARNNTNGS